MEKTDKQLIAALGGQSQLARLIGVHRCTVYQWTIRGIPKAWRLYLQKAYPELFRHNCLLITLIGLQLGR